MADKDLKAATPDTTFAVATAFLFGADTQSEADPSIYAASVVKAALDKGRTLFTLLPHGSIPPATLYATLDAIVDGSTPASVTPVLDFDGAAQDEHAEWLVVMPNWYQGAGLTLTIMYAMAGTDAEAVQFEVRALTMADTADLDTDLGMDTQTPTDITDTPTGTANAMMVTASGAISHANAGSPAAGSLMRIRVTRDFDHAANTDDAQLVAVHVAETP